MVNFAAMQFNKITRGNNRQQNTEQVVSDILDAGFLCHVAFQLNGSSHIIPTSYGRKGDSIFLHGSAKSRMLLEAAKNDQICICVTHLDGIVLAKTLFNTSANYRSAILYGSARIVEDKDKRMQALQIITENIIPGRWKEVKLGNENEVKATLVIEFKIKSASAKVRSGGPAGDENDGDQNIWSGHIPLKMIAEEPIADSKFEELPLSESPKKYYKKHSH